MFRIALTIVGVAVSHGWSVAAEPEPKELIPANGTVMDIMTFTESPRRAELSKKLLEAVAKDPEWWAAHVRKGKPGEPIEYDPKLGLTRDEFKEYLDTSFTLTKTGTVKAVVERTGERVLLAFGKDFPGMEEVAIDLKKDTVTTPFGVATDRTRIRANADQKATGKWDGVQWKHESMGTKPGSVTVIKFGLGKLTNGRGIMYCGVKKVSGTDRVSHRHTFMYDLAPAP
ncbi:MAG: hypothetical protein ACRC1K_14245 [Planctomycetia bacterium]